jgi:hypothetical protein
MKCYGCGIEKDLTKEEVYPYPEDEKLTTDPIPPLFVLECQSEKSFTFRAVVVCHECFRLLDPDMWIGENCWISINPIIPFDELPETAENDLFEPSSYPELVKK